MTPIAQIKQEGKNQNHLRYLRHLRIRIVFFFLVSATFVNSAFADAIVFTGTVVPLRDCTIEGFRGGQLFYIDNRGQRQRRVLDEIQRLEFPGMVELDRAERALSKEDFQAALDEFLPALLKAQTDLQKIWIHGRLSRVHDIRGENTQAASHAAMVMMLSDDAYWRRLIPANSLVEPTYAAAKEAFENLQAALKKVKRAELKTAIDRMLIQVQPVYQRLAKSYNGPAIESGSTISGISKTEIQNRKPVPIEHATEPAVEPKPNPTTIPASEPEAPPVATMPARPVAEPPAIASSDKTAKPVPPQPATAPAPKPPVEAPAVELAAARSIDAMLAQKRWAEALQQCEQIARNPGERDLAHFLFQYGSALSRNSRPDDAAVMFTRCAVLFPESSDAAHSLIQTAIIYRDSYHQPETFARLLQTALDLATMHNHESAAMLARELIGTK